jgi:hypothetical protein
MISAPVTASTPAELAARLASETAKWGPIVKEAGIKQEYPCAGESGRGRSKLGLWWGDTARLRAHLGAVVAGSRQRSTLWQRTIASNAGLSVRLL